jgi:hypothetical protein
VACLLRGRRDTMASGSWACAQLVEAVGGEQEAFSALLNFSCSAVFAVADGFSFYCDGEIFTVRSKVLSVVGWQTVCLDSAIRRLLSFSGIAAPKPKHVTAAQHSAEQQLSAPWIRLQLLPQRIPSPCAAHNDDSHLALLIAATALSAANCRRPERAHVARPVAILEQVPWRRSRSVSSHPSWDQSRGYG